MKKIVSFGLLLVLLDQVSKCIIENTLHINQTVPIIKNFFYLTYLKNNGAAWNILEGNTLFLISLGIVAIVFIIYLIKDETNMSKLNSISYSLLLGGIVGNLIDRIHSGSVIDFLYVNFLDFPIFNFSDICIVLGVIIFAFETIRSEMYVKPESKPKPKSRQVSRSK